jgi:1-deoxy-D-xylulose-5-phosphate reductoisomerase
MNRKRITILGSTGSIGRQALSVVEKFPDRFEVVGLSAGKNLNALKAQIDKFKPKMVSVWSETDAAHLKKFVHGSTEVSFGQSGLDGLAASPKTDLVLVALVGSAGLSPLMQAINAGKVIALANKEPMVMAGKIITRVAKKRGAKLIPVDSEHSAIFQLLDGKPRGQLRKVILSASGGPFLRKKTSELGTVSAGDALRHPTWKMGKKISVDSATLMNKALEIIEAKWLFNLDSEQIDVIIHPQSIVHSMVEMRDGAVFAHMSVPDMRIPIAFALFWPERPILGFQPLDLAKISVLKFERPDLKQFPSLRLGFQALASGGTLAAVMNGSNETAVAAFLSGRIRFNMIVRIVEKVMREHENTEPENLAQVLKADAWARARAQELIDE